MGRIYDSTNSPISLVGGISGRKAQYAHSPGHHPGNKWSNDVRPIRAKACR